MTLIGMFTIVRRRIGRNEQTPSHLRNRSSGTDTSRSVLLALICHCIHTHRKVTRHIVQFNDASCKACVGHRCMSCGSVLLLSAPSTDLLRASGDSLAHISFAVRPGRILNVPSFFNTRLGGSTRSFIQVTRLCGRSGRIH